MENIIEKGTKQKLDFIQRKTGQPHTEKYDYCNFHMIKSEIDLDVHNVILCLPERKSSKR